MRKRVKLNMLLLNLFIYNFFVYKFKSGDHKMKKKAKVSHCSVMDDI